ncbi:hypothetical protein KJ590_02315 [Patescibacteria group bacterium]|nr:hypothetical protein [Patescibacteria group bacterium]
MRFVKPNKKAIKEKVRQLNMVLRKKFDLMKLANLITKRRTDWFKAKKRDILKKYQDLPVEEKAYRIIYFDHMKINPEHSKMTRVNRKKIRIESHNFCPYLEACKELGLDTKLICKEVGEPSIQALCKVIDKKLKFSRNYKKIRPHYHFCEEFIEIT